MNLLYGYMYRIAGTFGGVNVWQIEIGKIKFGELIDSSYRDTIYKLNFGWLKFSKSWMTRQTFPLPNIPAIRYAKYSLYGINFHFFRHVRTKLTLVRTFLGNIP